MNQLRPNDQRARYAMIMMCIAVLVALISLFSEYQQLTLLEETLAGKTYDLNTFNANDTRQMAVGITSIVTIILNAVVFIMWFRRAYYNLHTRSEYLNHTEGWAAGSWFVPIVNLYRPYQIMKEIYTDTHSLLTKNVADYSGRQNTLFVGLWWTFWILNTVSGQVTFRLTKDADTFPELHSATMASMVDSAITICTALLAVKVILDYSRVEPMLAMVPDKTGNSDYTPRDAGGEFLDA